MAKIQSTLELLIAVQSEALSELKKFSKQIDTLEKTAKKSQGTFQGLWKQFAVGNLVASGLKSSFRGVKNVITSVISSIIKAGAQYEQTQIAFEVMLGSAEAGQRLLTELADVAVRTPFTLPGIEKNAKLLLAMGIETKNVIPDLVALGNIASGLSVPLERVAYNYGQVKAQTRLTGIELRDFSRAGIPLISELAKNLGVTEKAIKEMVSEGIVSFENVKEAFQTMTSEGGRFENLMERQATTLGGLFSNLQDSVTRFLRGAGSEAIEPFKDVVADLILLLEEKGDDLAISLKGVMGALAETTGKVLKQFVEFVESGALESMIEGFGKLASAAGKTVDVLGQVVDFLNDGAEAQEIATKAQEDFISNAERFEKIRRDEIIALEKVQKTQSENFKKRVDQLKKEDMLKQAMAHSDSEVAKLGFDQEKTFNIFQKASLENKIRSLEKSNEITKKLLKEEEEMRIELSQKEQALMDSIGEREQILTKAKIKLGEEEVEKRLSILEDLQVEDARIKNKILKQSGQLSKAEIKEAVNKANAQIRVAGIMKNKLASIFNKTLVQNVLVKITSAVKGIAQNPIQSILGGDIQGALRGMTKGMLSMQGVASNFVKDINSELGKIDDVFPELTEDFGIDDIGGGGGGAGGKSAAEKLKEEAEKASEEAEKALENMRDEAKKTWDQYSKLSSNVRESLTEITEKHIDSIGKIDEEVAGLLGNLHELQRGFEIQLGEIDVGRAEAIVNQKKLVEDLREEIRKADEDEDEDEDETSGLEKRLEREQAALLSTEELQKELSEEIGEIERRRSLTELERALEDFSNKQEIAKQEFAEKKAKIEQEVALLEDQKNQEIAIFEAKSHALALVADSAESFEQRFVGALENTSIKTAEHVSAIKDQLLALEATLESIREVSATPTAPSGGVVTAGAGGGMNVVVNVTGNTIGGDQNSANQLASTIEEKLTRIIQLQLVQSQ